MKESIAESLKLSRTEIIAASLALSEPEINLLLSKVQDDDLHVELLAYRCIAEQAEDKDHLTHDEMVRRFG